MSSSPPPSESPLPSDARAPQDIAWERFERAETGRERLAALHVLLAPGSKPQLPRRAELTKRLEVLHAHATTPNDERLYAVASLALVRSARILDEKAIRGWLQRALAIPLPPLEPLQEVDDRTRIMAALAELRPPWAMRYALPYAVDPGTWKGRLEAMRVIFAPALPFSDACADLAEAFEARWTRSTPTAAQRALAALLRDVEGILPRNLPLREENPSEGLVRIAEVARRLNLRDAPSREQRAVCDALVVLVSRVAHSRLRRALSPETYRPIRILRSAMTDGQWATVASAQEALAALLDEVSEALFVSVRAGLPDPGLRDALDALSPTGAAARTQFERIAREPGVPPAMQRWLLGESAPDAESPAAEAVNRASERELVASLVVAATSLEDWRVDHGAEGLPWERVEGLVEEVQALARRRGLRVGGFVGDVETFDPRRHMVTEMPPEGLTTVRLLTPLILCENPDGVTTVVRPAVTEAFRGGG